MLTKLFIHLLAVVNMWHVFFSLDSWVQDNPSQCDLCTCCSWNTSFLFPWTPILRFCWQSNNQWLNVLVSQSFCTWSYSSFLLTMHVCFRFSHSLNLLVVNANLAHKFQQGYFWHSFHNSNHFTVIGWKLVDDMGNDLNILFLKRRINLMHTLV